MEKTEEILAYLKALSKEEFELFCAKARERGMVITAADPLPPDPTHPHGN
jgi:hypothetical protein